MQSQPTCPFASGAPPAPRPSDPPSTEATRTRFEPIPVARAEGPARALASFSLLSGLLNDPAAQLERYRRRHGNIFSYSVRPLYDEIYYIFSLDAYRKILDTPPEDGLKAGPVRALIPTLSRWFPRSDAGPDHLEKLVVAGRAFIGSRLLRKERIASMRATIRRAIDRRAGSWSGRIDLTEELIALIYDCSARCVLGDDLWERCGAIAGPALRKIVRGIEIPRLALGLSPLGHLLPEYRAVQALHGALAELVQEHGVSRRYPVIDEIAAIEIDGCPLPRADLAWMIHYILWSAVTYPGTYGFWSFADIISRAEVQRALQLAAPDERAELVRDCITETLRISPVITLARMTTKPLDVECDDRWYRIPADRLVIVTPYAFNRDPLRFQDPDLYDPWRYKRGAPGTHSFGRGPYGCVAQHYVYVLLGTLFDELLARHTFRCLERAPGRLCNVHLIYPLHPFQVQVGRRAAIEQAERNPE